MIKMQTISGAKIMMGSTGNFSTSSTSVEFTHSGLIQNLNEPICKLKIPKPERAKRLLKKNNMIGEYARSGVYLLYYEKEIVYVGQSISPYRRIGQHIGQKKFDEFRILHCAKKRLNHWERKLINDLNPRYNCR
jgi:hypothetical protein